MFLLLYIPGNIEEVLAMLNSIGCSGVLQDIERNPMVYRAPSGNFFNQIPPVVYIAFESELH